MDDVCNHMATTAPDTPSDMADAQVLESHIAQAVTCGTWPLALRFEWANAIVDKFELVPIPGAAPWLVGAVNVDGSILPVVDLAIYFEPNTPPTLIDRHHRLLLGGKSDAGHENALAILFTSLPMQVQYTREPIDPTAVLPERLRDVCRGMARSSTGKSHYEINTDRLAEFLSLSLIDM